MVEDFVSFLLEEIAVGGGLEGYPFPRIWKTLSRAYQDHTLLKQSSNLNEVDEAVQGAVWSHLTQMSGHVSFFKRILADADGKKIEPAIALHVTEEGVLYTSQRESLPNIAMLSFEECKRLGDTLVAVASKDIRMRALGLNPLSKTVVAPSTAKKKAAAADEEEGEDEGSSGSLNASQYCTLEVVGRSQFDGVFQTDIGKVLKLPPKDLFVVVRVLEKQQLISRERSTKNASVSNRVWLDRFSDISLHPWNNAAQIEREKSLLEEERLVNVKTLRERKRKELARAAEKKKPEEEGGDHTTSVAHAHMERNTTKPRFIILFSLERRVRCELFAELSLQDQIYRKINESGRAGLFGTALCREMGISTKLVQHSPTHHSPPTRNKTRIYTKN